MNLGKRKAEALTNVVPRGAKTRLQNLRTVYFTQNEIKQTCFMAFTTYESLLLKIKELICDTRPHAYSTTFTSDAMTFVTNSNDPNFKFIEDESFETRDSKEFIGEERAKEILCEFRKECRGRRGVRLIPDAVRPGYQDIKLTVYTVSVELVLTTCSALMNVALDTFFLSDTYKESVAQRKKDVDHLLAIWKKQKKK